MTRNAFGRLCHILHEMGGLRDSKLVSIHEQVTMFVSVLAHHKKNHTVKYDFIRSGRTVSRHFHKVLNAILCLHPLLLAKRTPVPSNSNYSRWRWFEGCLGALDGTYIDIRVPTDDKTRYCTRKGSTTVNVLDMCDRNLNFIYGLSGWEGSAVGKEGKLSRRIWSFVGEESPLVAKKEIARNGWKSDNGFRTGYLDALEQLMNKSYPNSGLKPNPHISSKIHVWKKTYSYLLGMLSKSGFCWDGSAHVVDPYAPKLRHKSFPYYPSWSDVLVQIMLMAWFP
ncbi:UNVERIFIED_CONTAM: hypothetical protein Scaly_1482800 [Sesamum calycinum]|uniref:DUF8040 domain-containing protein n=1 Tax=Sesamum calycinum TaxID=2727403 RepID=A0AAW2PTN7_9LAMI